jgi:hypothetical protein
LTYMSIYDVIASRVKGQELFQVPSNLGFRRERQIVLAPDVKKFVFGPHTDQKVRTRRLKLEVELSWFVEGGSVAVALPDEMHLYKDQPDANLRLLHPWRDEVWEIRSKMQPQIRLFGSFAGPDVFVAVLWAYRKDLGEPPWVECETSKSEWKRFFPLCPPHTGRTVHDYITKNAISL